MKYSLSDFVRIIVDMNCKVKKGEKVYLKIQGVAKEYEKAIIEAVKKREASIVVVQESLSDVITFLKDIDEQKARRRLQEEAEKITTSQVFITLVAEEFDIPAEYQSGLKIYNQIYKRGIRDLRLKYCRWVSLRLPNEKVARMVNMTLDEFQEYYFNACCIDYYKMKVEAESLASLLAKTNKIKIITPNTNIEFQKNGIGARILAGDVNMPDGEIYTAPILESVNGFISFNTPSIKDGYKFEDIFLKFENGEIVEQNANNCERLNRIVSIDTGAKYIGEFAIGINPYIQKITGLTIFDEKVLGTVHFAIGQCYKDTNNGNNSALHWDLVLDLRTSSGGGKIWFDDKLFFCDGEWLK